MKIIRVFICTLIPVLLVSCTCRQYRNAAIEMQTRNPHFALEYLAKAAVADPENKEVIDLSRSIMRSIADDHRKCVEDNADSPEVAIADCDRIIASAHFVKSFPGNLNLPYDENERAQLSESAAEKCYMEGVAEEKNNNYRVAFDAYCRAVGFRNGYKDAVSKMESLQVSAVAQICISADALNPSHTEYSRRILNIISQEVPKRRPRFMKFTDKKEEMTAEGKVTVQNLDFSDTGWRIITQGNDTQVSNNRQYYASWILYERNISCSLTAGYTVKGLMNSDNYAGTSSKSVRWDQKYYTYQGELGLVPYSVKQFQSFQPPVPSREQFISQTLNPLCLDLSRQLFNDYK